MYFLSVLLYCCTYSFSLKSPRVLKHYLNFIQEHYTKLSSLVQTDFLLLNIGFKKNICYDLVSWIWISSILCDPEERPLLKGRETKGGDYLKKYGIFWATAEVRRIQELRWCYRECKVNKQAPPITRFCQDLGAV